MNFVKALATIVVIAVFSSSVAAQNYRVLVEPLNPGSSASGGKGTPVFEGTLVQPPKVVINSGDNNTVGTQLDLTSNMVIVIFFPSQRISDLDKLIKDLKGQIDKDPKDAAKVTKIIEYGKEKAQLLLTGTKAVTLYKSGTYEGHLDETRDRVKFLISKKPTGSDPADPPTEYTWDQLKAIYFLPPTPPKAGAAATPAEKPGDAWIAVNVALDALTRERNRLTEDYFHLAKERKCLEEQPWDLDPRMNPITRGDRLAQVNVQMEALQKSIRVKDEVITQHQIQLAYLPRPALQRLAEPYSAFPRLPCISLVPKCNDSTAVESQAKSTSERINDLNHRIDKTQSPPFQARFLQPAHFPLPQFGLGGDRQNGEGVVIYEGMRFVATRDGQYDVSFTTSTPAMAVTLRMQLVFAGQAGCGHTVTLPPIVLYPSGSFDGNYPGRSFQIHHSGYSPLIAERFADLQYMTVVRQGTARFGSWPEGINQFEVPNLYPVTQTTGSSSPTDAAP